jgi:tetrahydromethanopterin S-methyltransferase subunit C
VGLLGVVRPHLVSLCFEPQQLRELVCPTAQSPLTRNGRALDVDLVVQTTVSKADVLLVEFIGVVAAAVTGAAALRHIRGTSTPFGVPVALTVLKLPTGALTAFLGLLLMRGGFVPGLTALDNTQQIIAWAVVFGASQQLVTGLVDRQAQNVLDSVGNKTYEPTGRS